MKAVVVKQADVTPASIEAQHIRQFVLLSIISL